jgi:hypothetical protein
VSADAVARANLLLTETELFREFGMGDIAATARTVALDALELVDQLEAERSARRALQARCEQLQAIIGNAVHESCKAAA